MSSTRIISKLYELCWAKYAVIASLINGGVSSLSINMSLRVLLSVSFQSYASISALKSLFPL